ncbi:potassium voltage-gated channel subfamily D member 1 [Lates japonicus]|uniref:Potassium voltage-gated channel subfamily D member 1 n=1 Tax=Lates japonicus TaxID=270547 RepID=A0AAD3N727_LATJO|nr:potassium voltage-gated channel subfamily D member 1 [Lates japonicus]
MLVRNTRDRKKENQGGVWPRGTAEGWRGDGCPSSTQHLQGRLWRETENTPHHGAGLLLVTGFFIAVSVIASMVGTVPTRPPKGSVKNFPAREKLAGLLLHGPDLRAHLHLPGTCRLFARPAAAGFMRSVMSVISVVTIMPYYIGLVMPKRGRWRNRLTLRVFRLPDLQPIIIFATVCSVPRKGTKAPPPSASFWYTIVTMTTLSGLPGGTDKTHQASGELSSP